MSKNPRTANAQIVRLPDWSGNLFHFVCVACCCSYLDVGSMVHMYRQSLAGWDGGKYTVQYNIRG
jgi:hypothetical protein